ncbi:bifunctional succinylornithine transaminase/acetylornithine transaminase, partial [Pseudomonas syringae pv. actinidiae]|nr:bifunctional succinylornithine transaminase/acetylornithine transaminase [Pseudomonas syringae pv. actinidiae]
SVMAVGTHGTTYGGNPLACAVAEAALDVINTPEVLSGVMDRHARFVSALERINAQYDIFDEIRGMGLLLGAQLKPAWHGRARDFLAASADLGLMILVAGPDVIRFVPSLVITPEEIDQGMALFGKAVEQVVKGA